MKEKWTKNPGHQPKSTRRKRVRVLLRGPERNPGPNGRRPANKDGSYEPAYAPEIYGDKMAPEGWTADHMRWDASEPDCPMRSMDVVAYILLRK